MRFFSLIDSLDEIADIVNKCLGPLGSNDGLKWSDLRDVLIQLTATLIVFLIIRFGLWKKITALLDKRALVYNKSLKEAKEAEERALSLEQKLRQKYDESKAEINRLVQKAVSEGNKVKEEIISEAKAEAKKRLESNKADLDRQVADKKKQIKDQIVDTAFLIASKIIDRELHQEEYLTLVNTILKEA